MASKDPKKRRDPSERVARRLLGEGRITRELFDAAMRHHELTGTRFEESLVECGVSESDLLKMLGEMYRVQYITTEKLAAAGVDKRILALVPVQIAENREAVPVLLDRQKSVLTVVMADPDDVETQKELELATQVRSIKMLVARPAAVRAAIARFYHDDDFAFSILQNQNLDVARALERSPLPPPVQPVVREVRSEPRNASVSVRPRERFEPSREEDASPLPKTLSPALASNPPPKPVSPPSARRPAPVLSAPAPAPQPPLPAPAKTPENEPIGDAFQLAVVMVSLLEGNRKDLRGHSIQTARLVRKVGEKVGAGAAEVRTAEIAGLLHDLGKASSYHLTAYNVARFDGHQAVARKLFSTPARVVESARLAKAATLAVLHMYERYDGSGFPGSLRGSDIPLGSRILAAADSYMDLTSNPRNSFRRVLKPQEACEALREVQGSVFDPSIVDCLSQVVLGDEIAERLRSDRGTVLLVDPDVEETTVLELALLEKRYDVRVARTVEEAAHFLETMDIGVVVSEMTLASGTGFDLLGRVRKSAAHDVPFVFLSGETDSARVSEALEAGAADYLFKPLSTQVVAAKLRRILEHGHTARRARGVSGSLEEMALPDLVQILHQGRKTGALSLSAEGESGTIFFKDGAIVDVAWRGLRGDEAFYAIVGVSKGDFTIDPLGKPTQETVTASPEMLLLEGMRRLDEAAR